jgi:AcrR family transcriptional regulator
MPTTKRRKTQAERTAATRKRLLDATIAVLNERGYANTTTTLIAERAGVSRGAQLHHFHTKADLVLAAIEHLFDRHLREFRQAMQGVTGDEDRIYRSIDLLWGAISEEETRHTWIELVVGTRTDPVLREKVWETARRLGETMVQIFTQEVAPGTPLPDVVVFITTALMDGLLVQRMAGLEEARAREVIETYKNLARVAVAAVQMGGGSLTGWLSRRAKEQQE